MTPSELLWRACGSPSSHKAHGITETGEAWERCWVCAGETHGRGCPIAEWDGASFTGQTRVKCARSQVICEPCLWVMARHSPVPDKTGNWRNYSVLYADGEPITIASKGDKPAILSWLRRAHRAPWFAAIGESGQKHVVPYVPLNAGGRARALFDEVLIELPRDAEGWSIVDDLAALLTAGATKEEVERGEYAGAWTRCEPALRAFETRYGHLRGSGWFSLVGWLSQRDEAAVEARMRKGPTKNGSNDGGEEAQGRSDGRSEGAPERPHGRRGARSAGASTTRA